jgi:predicted metal-dependent hydrolase
MVAGAITPVDECLDSAAGCSVAYRIRMSARARNVRLRLSARDGLTVVVPLHFNLRRIPAIVEQKRAWIEAHLRRFAAMPAAALAPLAPLPERIDLPALGESWSVLYRPARTRKVGSVQEPPDRVVVYGAVDDRTACCEVLKRWLCIRARELLVPWLDRLAAEGGFRFAEAVIRGQKTRWASCSSAGMISLSFKLLFLKREEVRCVLLHELCHTQCMNHSPRFWQLLNRYEPACKQIHRGMRDGWKRVPAWVEEPTGNMRG